MSIFEFRFFENCDFNENIDLSLLEFANTVPEVKKVKEKITKVLNINCFVIIFMTLFFNIKNIISSMINIIHVVRFVNIILDKNLIFV